MFSTKFSQKARYLIELATSEKTLLALDPINRMVPTTTANTTASMTAYSAMSCPSSAHNCVKTLAIHNLKTMMKGGVIGDQQEEDKSAQTPEFVILIQSRFERKIFLTSI